jgi:mono/diheme cytochrome c family protein
VRAWIAVWIVTASSAAFANADLWKAKCKSCHGEDGRAQTTLGKKQKIKDMSTAEWQSGHSDPDIRKAIVEGVPDTKMKPFEGKLSDAEIAGLVKYVRAFKK